LGIEKGELGMTEILIMEDDPRMGDLLKDKLLQRLGERSGGIEILETESEFRLAWLNEYREGRRQTPRVIVIDVMLPWTQAAPDQPARPVDVIEGGHVRAGLRCRAEIAQIEGLKNVPLILYSSLTADDLRKLGWEGTPGVIYVSKDDGDEIVNEVVKALAR